MNNLDTRIQKIMELDKARTQGDWVVDSSGVAVGKNYDAYICDTRCSPDWQANAQFIAAMPEAVSIIAELREENLKMRGAATVTLDFLNTAKIIHDDSEYVQVEDIVDQLTQALTNANGESNG